MDEAWLKRCRKRMERINALPRPLRELVDDEGWTVVDAFLCIGLRVPDHIRALIKATRENAPNLERQFASFGVTKANHITHLIKSIRAESHQGWTEAPDDSGPLRSNVK